MGIGAEIARARQAAGLSHADLAARTRIRSGIIQALERDDFDACGGTVYVRGHLRAIGTALGVDAKPWLDELGATDASTNLVQEEPQQINIWDLRNRSKSRSERRSWVLLIIGAVALIGAFSYFARLNTAQPVLVPSETPSMTATPSTTATPGATSTPDASPNPVDTNAPLTNAAITLQLDCTSSSWVRVTNDLGTLYEGTLRGGESKIVTSDSAVTVKDGNAAGVSITYNGQLQPSLGGPGQVYTNTFGE